MLNLPNFKLNLPNLKLKLPKFKLPTQLNLNSLLNRKQLLPEERELLSGVVYQYYAFLTALLEIEVSN